MGDEELPGIGLVDLRTVRGGRPAADRQLRDRGRPWRRPPRDRRLREPRRAHAPRGAAEPLGKVLSGHGNNGSDGYEGVRQRQRDRHLPARPAAAEERVAGGLADRGGAGYEAGTAGRRDGRRGARLGSQGGRRLGVATTGIWNRWRYAPGVRPVSRLKSRRNEAGSS